MSIAEAVDYARSIFTGAAMFVLIWEVWRVRGHGKQIEKLIKAIEGHLDDAKEIEEERK